MSGEEDYQNLIRGKPIFHYWIFAALAVLAAELGLQWFFNHLSLTTKRSPTESKRKAHKPSPITAA